MTASADRPLEPCVTVSARPPRPGVARAELVIAGHPRDSLAALALAPDLTDAFARVNERVADDEQVTVTMDLVALTHREHKRWMKRQLQQAGAMRKPSKGGSGALDELLEELGEASGKSTGRIRQGEQVAHSRRAQALRRRLDEPVLFQVQLLLRAESPRGQDRARQLIGQVLTPFEAFTSEKAHWRVRGLFRGGAELGADLPLVRSWFDFRWRTAYARPRRRNIAGVSELAPLIKPPGKHASSRGLVRFAGDVAPPPRSIPSYRRQPGVLPLGGVITAAGGWDVVGQQMYRGRDKSSPEYFFGMTSGRSRFGKTELALAQVAHVAHIEGDGAFFTDPHRDAIQRLKPYLADVAERVIELDFTGTDLGARHVAWNPISMQGYERGQLYQRAQAMIDALSVLAGWNKSTGRVLTIARQAITTLCLLSLALPPELSPTMLTISRLVDDEEWREAVAGRLPDELARYWRDTYPSYGAGSQTPLTNILARLLSPDLVRATLGSPISTYHARTAMDSGAIVLAAPGSSKENNFGSFLMFDAIAAAQSRANTAPELRRPFYIFADEAQSWDDGKLIADIVEQLAKYGVRLMLMVQSPAALTERTRGALATNASVLVSTAQDEAGAKWFAKQWASADGVDRLLQRMPRFHYLAQITESAQRCDPFRLSGLEIGAIWRDKDRGAEGARELEATLDRKYRPRTVMQSLDAIDGHDDAIVCALGGQLGSNVPDLPDPATAPSFGAVDFN